MTDDLYVTITNEILERWDDLGLDDGTLTQLEQIILSHGSTMDEYMKKQEILIAEVIAKYL